MEELLEESRAIYEILKVDTREAYELQFLEHKKQVMDVVRNSMEDTSKRICEVNDNLDVVHTDMSAELAQVKYGLGSELAAAKSQLSTEIAELASNLDCAIQVMLRATVGEKESRPIRQLERAAAGPVGHRSTSTHPGQACGFHTPPPGGVDISATPLGAFDGEDDGAEDEDEEDESEDEEGNEVEKIEEGVYRCLSREEKTKNDELCLN